MKKLAIAILFTLAGCGGLPSYQGMSPEQISAAAKDNKAVFQCADIPTSGWVGGGIAKVRSMVIDSGTVRYGRFEAKSCDDIVFTNENKPAAVGVGAGTTVMSPAGPVVR